MAGSWTNKHTQKRNFHAHKQLNIRQGVRPMALIDMHTHQSEESCLTCTIVTGTSTSENSMHLLQTALSM